jgi:hypothetical protein
MDDICKSWTIKWYGKANYTVVFPMIIQIIDDKLFECYIFIIFIFFELIKWIILNNMNNLNNFS